MPSHRLALCKNHYIEWFERRVESTIKEFKMFSKNDRVLVAVSGGKDSLALWHALVKLGYQADGLYIDLGIGEYSKKSKEIVKSFAQRIEKNLHIVELEREIATIPTIKEVDSRPACSFCGTIKRYYMNKMARDLKYDVIATGHNLDDETAVLFSNVLSWNIDYLKRQYPVLREEKGFVKKVKPLCKMTEKENALYAFFNRIEYIEDECPFAEGSTSISYKKLLASLEEQSPGSKIRFYLEFLRKVHPILDKDYQKSLSVCKVCGEPSSSEICPICRLKAKVGV